MFKGLIFLHMKHLLLLNYLLFTKIFFSQELPDVPIKNGMTYHSFNHKLDNQKKCLSNYFTFSSSEYISMTSAISKNSNTQVSGITLILIPVNKPSIKCVDTISYSNQSLQFVMENSVSLKPYMLQGTIRIVFTSKNQYTLQILNLKYNSLYSQKSDKNELFGIGEIYERIEQRGKATKKEIKFFNEINLIAEKIDEIVLKSVSEVYRADDL